MMSKCQAGEPITAGPCKRCGATDNEHCHIFVGRALNAFDDMLAALKAVECGAPFDVVIHQVRAAIAKAEGK